MFNEKIIEVDKVLWLHVFALGWTFSINGRAWYVIHDISEVRALIDEGILVPNFVLAQFN